MARPIVPSDFGKYLNTIYQEYVFPIIPKTDETELSDGSQLTKDQLGKIPGVFNMETKKWSGMSWPSFRAKRSNLERWDDQQDVTGPTAIGMNTVKFPALDVDVNDGSPHAKEIADLARSTAEGAFGSDTPVIRRREDSERCVLFFEHEDHTPPIRKVRRTYEAPDGTQHTIELLSSGQLVVIEGPHTSRKMHLWEADDRGLVDHQGELPIVNVTKVDAYFDRLDEVMATFGYPRIKNSPTASGGDNTPAVAVNDLSSPHMAKDMTQLENAIKAIDLDDPQLDYDAFITLLRAICAACGGSFHFLHTVVWPWLCTQKIARGQSGKRTEERGIEWVEERWRSFPDSQVGAEHVYIWAAANGYTEALTTIKNTQVQDIFANAPIQTPDQPDDGLANTGTAGPNTPALPGAAGGGPIPANDTHWEIAQTFIAAYGHEWRYNVDAKRWYKFSGVTWQPCDTIMDTLGRMMAGMAQQILVTVNGPSADGRARALKSMGGIASVRNLLQGLPELIVTEADFDAHHHLLNTPDGIIDLRTGEMASHDATLLLRNVTLVTPDYMAMGGYEERCKRFFKVLANVSWKREHIIKAIRAWYAYTLTGDLRHQALMFLYGPPGVGKTVIAEILYILLGSYAFLINESFLSKNGGETKRFDMAGIIGKRMLFMDETQLGMTWDETRMSKLGSAQKLTAELKFGRPVEFTNTGKIFVVGNHKPNFVAAETGGLTSRMLLCEAQGINYRDPKNGGIETLAQEIAAEEGPAILRWALEQCVADYNTPGLFNELTAELRDASREYAKEDSLFHQWVNHEMAVREGLDINTLEALDHYLEFSKKYTHGRASVIKLSAFKHMLVTAFPSIDFGNRTKGPQKNKAYIKGFGYQNQLEVPDGGQVAQVIPFPTQQA